MLARSAHLNLKHGDGMGAAKLAADFGAVVILPAIASALLYGHCAKDESYFNCLGREIGLYFAGFFPIIRDVVMASWGSYGYRMSPIGSAGDAVAQLPAATYRLATGESTPADPERVLIGAAYSLGLPGLQIWRTFDHLEQVYSGETDFNPWYLVMGQPHAK